MLFHGILILLTAVGETIAAPAPIKIGSSPLGYWATPCSRLPPKTMVAQSVAVRLNFSETSVNGSTQMFADGSCKSLNLIIQYAATYQMGQRRENAFDWDHMTTSAMLTIKNPDLVVHANTHQLCGITDWVLNKQQDVSGRFCDPFRIARIGQKVKDILAINGDRMKFGAFPKLPKRNDSRPDSWDPQFIFVKSHLK